MNFHGVCPKIVWRTTKNFVSDSFETPPYGASAPYTAFNTWWANSDAGTMNLAQGGGPFFHEPLGYSFNDSRSGAHRMVQTYLGVPAGDHAHPWDLYAEHTYGGYAPGQKVVVSVWVVIEHAIFDFGGHDGPWSGFDSTPIGIWVNGVQNVQNVHQSGFNHWQKLDVLATADVSGNLVVRLGTFGGWNDSGFFATQRIIGFDDLNLPAPPFVTADQTLDFGYPPMKARSWSQPDPGSNFINYDSGLQDAWVIRNDRVLSLDVYAIPANDETTGYGPSSGWNKWRDFLEAARDGQVFDFYPDKDGVDFVQCVLVEPKTGTPTIGWLQSRGLTLQIRRLDNDRWEGY